MPGNKNLQAMFFFSFISCIADPICFSADGKPGMLSRVLVYGCNTWLFLSNVVVAFLWILLVSDYLKIKLRKLHLNIWLIACVGAVVLLIVNIFVPIVFAVSEDNVYSRLNGNIFFVVLHYSLMAYGILISHLVKLKSGGLKLFPVWAFIIPAAIGATIQTVFYGLSTVAPFITVSLVCVSLCLQNDFMFRDRLTGLYNRFYLDTIEHKLTGKTSREYTAMMLDINKFKAINDTYGHKAGDEALINLSEILCDVVNTSGSVIRYAGDEFIIILNTHNDEFTENIISSIHKTLNDFNNSGVAPYKLAVAVGHCKLHFTDNLDEFFDKIDKLMYEDKRRQRK